MKKLNLKAIKDGKWQDSCAQLSESEMTKLKGGGTGCVTYQSDGYGNWRIVDEDPYCDYPDEYIYE